MGFLTTHVLDTAQGIPGQGIEVSLYRATTDGATTHKQLIRTLQTNSDGRTDQPILSEQEFEMGTWELIFKTGSYFIASPLIVDDPPFLDEITIQFSMSRDDHYHVPLVVSPWSYSTYRGS